MANPRFFKKNRSLTLDEVIKLTDAVVDPAKEINRNALIEDIAPLDSCLENQLSFFINSKYLNDFKNSKAGFCFADERFKSAAPSGMTLLISKNPYKAYAIIAKHFYANEQIAKEISPNSFISKKAKIGKNCFIGNFVVIEDDVEIGDDCYIDHNSVIKKSVIIGPRSKIMSNVTISHAIIGSDVLIHPGVRIGQDGFGFASDSSGHMKVQQLGIVKIGNFVEIGANTCIDRGSAQDTIIKDMAQIDNLVQIGHNVQVGIASVIVAQVGIAGSAKLGNFSVLGGQVGVAGHLSIGDQVQVAAQSGVAQDVPDKQIIGGSPAVPIRQWHRQNFMLQKLVKKDITN